MTTSSQAEINPETNAVLMQVTLGDARGFHPGVERPHLPLVA